MFPVYISLFFAIMLCTSIMTVAAIAAGDKKFAERAAVYGSTVAILNLFLLLPLSIALLIYMVCAYKRVYTETAKEIVEKIKESM